jgi:hypothetical protein
MSISTYLREEKDVLEKKHSLIFKRRFPRRQFSNYVGVLANGKYSVANGLQVGEGGLRIQGGPILEKDQVLLLTFRVANSPMGVIRGVIKYRVDKPDGLHEYGIQFDSANLDPELLISIRSFVAKKSESEAQEEINLWRKTLTEVESDVAAA